MPKPKKIKLKLKTHKGAQKRFKLTATGKVERRHAFARHILTSKASRRKRRLGNGRDRFACECSRYSGHVAVWTVRTREQVTREQENKVRSVPYYLFPTPCFSQVREGQRLGAFVPLSGT